MSGSNLILFTLIVIACLTKPSTAQQLTTPSSACAASSSCGDITISYPFRLQTRPAECGFPDPAFELRCRENRTILTTGSRAYRVAEINYSRFRLRVVDPGLDSRNYTSCPVYSYTDGLWENEYLSPDSISNFHDYITFISCTKPLNNTSFVEEDSCGNTTAFSKSSRVYSYVGFDRILNSDLEGHCVLNREVLVSSDERRGGIDDSNGNYSYRAVHDLMVRGVELTWFRTMCGDCDRSRGACVLEGDKVTCRHNCYEDTPLSERSFRCKLEYYSVYSLLLIPILGGIIGLRLLFGIPLLIALVVYKWRKQRRSLARGESNC